jgi:hypothetical protein
MGFCQRFKRNQVEEAVIATLAGDHNATGPSLRIRMKRLFDADRELSLEEPGSATIQYAFFSDDAPGSGVEVWFSPYEAFAILIALRILAHGWPQSTVVRIMRRVRKDLENEHRRIMEQGAEGMFSGKALEQEASPGLIFTESTDPVFLAITAAESLAKPRRGLKGFAVCRGQDRLMEFILKEMPVGMVTTSLELSNAAHRLAANLAQTQPSRRGRMG